ncbi:MarR family transcriptional regulator [Feifania hominis]|uniref:MarR family transcriptional regulator n=1 Tax=Feifania hominis TaxID=2763660 RepID=A0A926HV21_9FIRM|nr:MarR family transcriptional regulator [Feifania hominis]
MDWDNTVQAPMMQIFRLYFQIAFHRMEKLGIHPGQVPLFQALAAHDGQSQRELADSLCIKQSTMTVMIQRLERSGFVERRADEHDQRVSRVYLTDAGRDIAAQCAQILHGIQQQLLEGFTPEEIILMRRFSKQIKENLVRAAEAAQRGGRP